MTGMFAAWPRKVLIASIAISGCLALFVVASAAVKAEQMVASWYGPGFEGATTASGEPFDPYDYTAASKTYDFGTRLIVTYEGRSVVVRITDRGPYIAGRNLDLSQGAAEYLGLTAVGVDTVNVEVTTADTPTGPYGGTREVLRPAQNAQSSEPMQDTQQAQQRPVADADQAGAAQPEGQQQEKARQDFASIGEDQYKDDVSEDQYKNEVVVEEAVPPAPPAPKPAVPVLPPRPEPAALEAPPVELAVPNSTIERRVELDVAAPPAPEQPVEAAVAEETVEPVVQETPEPVVEETPEPTVQETPEPVVEEVPEPGAKEKQEPEKSEPKKSEATGPGGITVLPDTGGAPLGALFLAGGAMLLGAGIAVRITRC